MGYLAREDSVARRGDLRLTMADVRSVVLVTHKLLPAGSPGPPRRRVPRRHRPVRARQRLPRRDEEAPEGAAGQDRRGCRAERLGARLCGYGPDSGAGAGDARGPRMARKEHHAHPTPGADRTSFWACCSSTWLCPRTRRSPKTAAAAAGVASTPVPRGLCLAGTRRGRRSWTPGDASPISPSSTGVPSRGSAVRPSATAYTAATSARKCVRGT